MGIKQAVAAVSGVRHDDTHETTPEPQTGAHRTPGAKAAAEDDLQILPLSEVKERLGFSADGLTQVEAQDRLVRYGPNEIEEKKANSLMKLLALGQRRTGQGGRQQFS